MKRFLVGNGPVRTYIRSMTNTQFDTALVTAAFALAAEQGWRHVSAAAAARHAGLDLAIARQRFGSRGAILRKFGELADCAALTGAVTEGPVRDRLFDILLLRFDFLQTHRAGVLALTRVLPLEPALALCLARANLASMGWILEAAGIGSKGARGELRKRGLLAVWAYGMHAWMRDESADLSATMAAVDKALHRADALATRFTHHHAAHAPQAATEMSSETAADIPFDVPPDPSPEDPSGLA
jgi:ubiquinone biosynthesis protein COQ9